MNSPARGPFATDPKIQAILCALDENASLKTRLNGVTLQIPVGTILTMAHRVEAAPSGELVVDVETSHLDWMRSRLRPGSVLLDIGAATGAVTLPVAAAFSDVQIIAFEPARRARRLLGAALTENRLSGVCVVEAAISDHSGTVPFAEYGVSLDGNMPFLPEVSTLFTHSAPIGTEVVYVPAITLDEIATTYGLDRAHVVVKLDIEGFEVRALSAGARFFAANDVAIAIDIHSDPSEPTITTEAACRETLSRFGYSKQQMLGHVLLCERS